MSHCILLCKIWHKEKTVCGQQSTVFGRNGKAFAVWIDALRETLGHGLFLLHGTAEGEFDAEESQEVADRNGHDDCAGLAGELHQVKMRLLVPGGTQLLGWDQVERNCWKTTWSKCLFLVRIVVSCVGLE